MRPAVMDTHIRWKVKRRIRNAHVALVVLLLFVTTQTSSGKWGKKKKKFFFLSFFFFWLFATLPQPELQHPITLVFPSHLLGESFYCGFIWAQHPCVDDLLRIYSSSADLQKAVWSLLNLTAGHLQCTTKVLRWTGQTFSTVTFKVTNSTRVIFFRFFLLIPEEDEHSFLGRSCRVSGSGRVEPF